MKKITCLFIVLTVSIGFSQQILIEDFDGTAPSFAGFEGLASASIEAAPAGSNGNSFKMVSQVAGNPWQGAEVIMQTYNIKLTTDKTASVDVYSSQAFTLLAKVENGGPASAAAQSYTTPGSWQTLTFTFTQALDGTGAANGEYSKIVFFPNWKSDNTGFNNPPADFTIYVDNITAEGAAIAADPEPSDAPPTPPSLGASDVISIFSEAYTPATTISNVPWDDSNFEEVTIASNQVLRITGANFIGIDLGAYLNATNMTHLHIDYWIAPDWTAGMVLNPKLSNHAAQAGETSAINMTNIINSQAEVQNWQSKDFPLNADARESIKQFLITQSGFVGLFYLDNVYMYNAAALSVNDFVISNLKAFPNPTETSWTVKTGGGLISSIQVYDLLGKNVLSLNPNSQEAEIDGSPLSKGIYLAKVAADNGSSTLRLIKN